MGRLQANTSRKGQNGGGGGFTGMDGGVEVWVDDDAGEGEQVRSMLRQIF